MTRQHIPDGEIAVAVIDVPFYLRAPPELSVTDYYIALNGQRPRFRADWDNFASIQEYEEFCDAWIDEVMRCLDDRGSMFIHGCFTNINIIGRLLQMKGIWINNQIAWAKRNSRPIVCRTRLRHSNEYSPVGRQGPEAVPLQLPAVQDVPRSAGFFQRTR